MLRFVERLFNRSEAPGFRFSKPLVLLHSDDWGRVGVRDLSGYQELRGKGFKLGERAHDLYTLETAEDVKALTSLLERHRDATGRACSMTMNLCTANLDFARMRDEGFTRPLTLPLGKGLPGRWSRPGLQEEWQRGVARGLLVPALHGTLHFSLDAIMAALTENRERAKTLRLLWGSETPYIFWRMPWVDFEYSKPGGEGLLSLVAQRQRIAEACENFVALFGRSPGSACAPGYRSNEDTHRAWSEVGVRVAQHGTGNGLRAPYKDAFGILHTYRNIDFEPISRDLPAEKYVEIARTCFSRGIPLIISVHSINFHSTIRDFRSATIAGLDRLLSALEAEFPQLHYVNDDDLHALALQGPGGEGRIDAIHREENQKYQEVNS